MFLRNTGRSLSSHIPERVIAFQNWAANSISQIQILQSVFLQNCPPTAQHCAVFKNAEKSGSLAIRDPSAHWESGKNRKMQKGFRWEMFLPSSHERRHLLHAQMPDALGLPCVTECEKVLAQCIVIIATPGRNGILSEKLLVFQVPPLILSPK